ncbi:MAG TPA: NfeD family protein [Xanthomonadaceae bacterium]|jgi:membrane protein implicated in regulation of membrane protease activity|nr:NfeD family protein [Xanthomonadaceae bacterium]
MSTNQIVWACVAVVLMGAEMAAPGAFMLWLGIAAAGVFAIVLVVPDLAPIWQAVWFVLLSAVSVTVYWTIFRKTRTQSDQPLLNRRALQHIGHRYPLAIAIVNGQGKAQVGDSLWLVAGPDLPAGATIEVIGVEGTTLKVKAVG